MLGYIEGRPYVPPTHYDEREWLAFRSIFIKIYKAKHVLLHERQVPVTMLRATLKSSSKFRITKGTAACYVPEFDGETDQLPDRWVVSKRAITTMGVHGLGVGIFSWWGQTDKKITLASPQKNVRFGLLFYLTLTLFTRTFASATRLAPNSPKKTCPRECPHRWLLLMQTRLTKLDAND